MRRRIAEYWRRLRVTSEDTERGYRSFWLQFTAQRFPEIKNAVELIRVAQQFYAWHRDGTVGIANDGAVSHIRIVE
jgi:hypothetical protein